MRTIGNIIWILICGIESAIAFVIVGLLLCLTIIGIPAGQQCFKMAGLVLTPFGKTVYTNFAAHPVLNLVWAILIGWEMAVAYLAVGLALCVTVIGIPFGLQVFKLMQLILFPFGANVR